MERVNNYLFTFNYTFEEEGDFTFSVFYLETGIIKAKYYNSSDFSGSPTNGAETLISDNWYSNGPLVRHYNIIFQAISPRKENFSIIYDAVLIPPSSRNYIFQMEADDKGSLYLST